MHVFNHTWDIVKCHFRTLFQANSRACLLTNGVTYKISHHSFTACGSFILTTNFGYTKLQIKFTLIKTLSKNKVNLCLYTVVGISLIPAIFRCQFSFVACKARPLSYNNRQYINNRTADINLLIFENTLYDRRRSVRLYRNARYTQN
jgi:hypothetical protein